MEQCFLSTCRDLETGETRPPETTPETPPIEPSTPPALDIPSTCIEPWDPEIDGPNYPYQPRTPDPVTCDRYTANHGNQDGFLIPYPYMGSWTGLSFLDCWKKACGQCLNDAEGRREEPHNDGAVLADECGRTANNVCWVG